MRASDGTTQICWRPYGQGKYAIIITDVPSGWASIHDSMTRTQALRLWRGFTERHLL